MKIKTFGYFFSESMRGLWRNRLMSTASIGAVAVAIIILGTFLIIGLNVDYLSAFLESQVEITVYLEDEASDSDIAAIGSFLLEIPGVEEITFFSKEDALKMMREQLGERQNLLDAFEEDNPLPNFYRIKAETPGKVEFIASAVSTVELVEKVDYGKEFIERLMEITRFLRLTVIVLSIILTLLAVFIISNTIKLTVFARRKEINIMKYVGATDWFIRWPFFIEGMVLGVLGSGISITIIWLSYVKIYESISYNFPIIPVLEPSSVILPMAKWFVAFGVLLGALGSSLSIRRFLKV